MGDVKAAVPIRFPIRGGAGQARGGGFMGFRWSPAGSEELLLFSSGHSAKGPLRKRFVRCEQSGQECDKCEECDSCNSCFCVCNESAMRRQCPNCNNESALKPIQAHKFIDARWDTLKAIAPPFNAFQGGPVNESETRLQFVIDGEHTPAAVSELCAKSLSIFSQLQKNLHKMRPGQGGGGDFQGAMGISAQELEVPDEEIFRSELVRASRAYRQALEQCIDKMEVAVNDLPEEADAPPTHTQQALPHLKTQLEQVRKQEGDASLDLLERLKVAQATWHLTEIFSIDADVDIAAQMVKWCQSTYPSVFTPEEITGITRWNDEVVADPQKRGKLCVDREFWRLVFVHALRADPSDGSAKNLLELIHDPLAALPASSATGAGAASVFMGQVVDQICQLLSQVPTSRHRRESREHDGSSWLGGASQTNTSSSFLSATPHGQRNGDSGQPHAWLQWHERCKMLLRKVQSTRIGAAGHDLGNITDHMALEEMSTQLQLLLRLMCGEPAALDELVEAEYIETWPQLFHAKLLYSPDLLQLQRCHVHKIIEDCMVRLEQKYPPVDGRNVFEANFLEVARFDVSVSIKTMHEDLKLPWAAAHLGHLIEEAPQSGHGGAATGLNWVHSPAVDYEYTEGLWLQYCEGLWRSGDEQWRQAIPYLLSPCCPMQGPALVRAMVSRAPIVASSLDASGGSSVSDRDIEKLLLLLDHADMSTSEGKGSGASVGEGVSIRIAMCLARGQHWLRKIAASEASAADDAAISGQGRGLGQAFRWIKRAAQIESEAASRDNGGVPLHRHFDRNGHVTAGRRFMRLVAALLHRNMQYRPSPEDATRVAAAGQAAAAAVMTEAHMTEAAGAETGGSGGTTSSMGTSAGAGVRVFTASSTAGGSAQWYRYDRLSLQKASEELNAVVSAIMPPVPVPAPITAADAARLKASADTVRAFAGRAAGVVATEATGYAESMSINTSTNEYASQTPGAGPSNGNVSRGGHSVAGGSGGQRASHSQTQQQYAVTLLEARVREERLLFAAQQMTLTAQQPVARFLQKMSELLLVLTDITYVEEQQHAIVGRYEQVDDVGADMAVDRKLNVFANNSADEGGPFASEVQQRKTTDAAAVAREWEYTQQCMAMLHQQAAVRIVELLEYRMPHPHEHYTKQFWHYLLTISLPLLPRSLAEGQKAQRSRQNRRRQKSAGGGVPYCVFGHRQSLVLLECLTYINTTAARTPPRSGGMTPTEAVSGGSDSMDTEPEGGGHTDGGASEGERAQRAMMSAGTRHTLRVEITRAVARAIHVA
jgi:hypothetical protein